jgi:hypothetical protein
VEWEECPKGEEHCLSRKRIFHSVGQVTEPAGLVARSVQTRIEIRDVGWTEVEIATLIVGSHQILFEPVRVIQPVRG